MTPLDKTEIRTPDVTREHLTEREELIEMRRVRVAQIGLIDCVLDSKSPFSNLAEVQELLDALREKAR